jgi:hypothetical protein
VHNSQQIAYLRAFLNIGNTLMNFGNTSAMKSPKKTMQIVRGKATVEKA